MSDKADATTEEATGEVTTKPATEEEVREALYDVVDPELGIDVVNLGLIYGIHIDDANIATLDMTLTSAACPLTDVIEDQAKSATDGIVNELGSTGSGCRRGARTRSPTRAASSSARWASTSESERRLSDTLQERDALQDSNSPPS